jgi:hypothetical protein
MNLTVDLPYDAVVGSIVGITILGIVYLITRTIVRVNGNKTTSCSCNNDEW